MAAACGGARLVASRPPAGAEVPARREAVVPASRVQGDAGHDAGDDVDAGANAVPARSIACGDVRCPVLCCADRGECATQPGECIVLREPPMAWSAQGFELACDESTTCPRGEICLFGRDRSYNAGNAFCVSLAGYLEMRREDPEGSGTSGIVCSDRAPCPRGERCQPQHLGARELSICVPDD